MTERGLKDARTRERTSSRSRSHSTPREISLHQISDDQLERIADRAAKRAAEETAKKMLKEMVNQAVTQVTEQLNPRFEELQRANEQINSRMTAMEAKQESSPAKSESDAGTSVSTKATTAATASKSYKDRAPFVPTYLEIKGWVKNWDDVAVRSSQMIDEREVKQIIDKIFEELNEEMKGYTDEEATRKGGEGRSLAAKILVRLKPTTTSDQAWKLRNQLKAIFDTKGGLPHGSRILVQAAPWKQPHLNEIGKFYGALRTVRADTTNLKAETGPPESRMIYKGGDRPEILATFTEKKGWSIQEAVLQKVTNAETTAASMVQALKERE